jgi:amino acid transporter
MFPADATDQRRQLNWVLAWAVVFCDIGPSVYYVPGILYGHVKNATPFFVFLLKYIEISWRNPGGGGVVTITTNTFGPMWVAWVACSSLWITSSPRLFRKQESKHSKPLFKLFEKDKSK